MGYKRIILKLTGEIFSHGNKTIAEEIKKTWTTRTQIAVVIGGGNIVRGRELPNTDEEARDYMGMLATVINALALQDALKKLGVSVRTQTAIEMKYLAEPFIPKKAIRHLEKERLVILACGTGHPHCTTDYAAVLRALELKADAILKGTKVAGIYKNFPDTSEIFTEISYGEVQKLRIKNIFDNAALGLMIDAQRKIPTHIFNIFEKENLQNVLRGEPIGTKIIP